jgi:hypothetical protein
MKPRELASDSPGKLADRKLTVLSALPSRLTSVLARSRSLYTCAAMRRQKVEHDAERHQLANVPPEIVLALTRQWS